MFNTPLARITFTMIEEFCKTWTEGVRVEYKRAIPSNIPKTVSSFANTMGGIWIIGVDTDKTTNLGVVPISGFPAIPGIEERITQACYQGIYPPMTPSVRVFPVPSNPKNVVVVVKVAESMEAPHAIQNRTTVFVRVNSTTEPYALAEIDRIEFLLNRRRQPEQQREEMIARMLKRSNLPVDCLRIMIGPRYPYRPLVSEDALTERLNLLAADPNYVPLTLPMRRVQDGFISAPPVSASSRKMSQHFEANIYGMIYYAFPLDVEEKAIRLVQIVLPLGRIVRLATVLLRETTANLFIRVQLEGIAGYHIVPTDSSRVAVVRPGRYSAIEDFIKAETDALRETLDDPLIFGDHIAELVRQLMWAFDWAETERIRIRTAEILHANGMR